MRRHERFERFAPRIDAETFAEVVRVENLIAARLDPGYSAHEGVLDLTFALAGRVAIVPWIVIQGMMLLERESSPLIWPAWLPPLRPEAIEAIEEAVEPWLLSLTIARFCNEEILRIVTADPQLRELVECAEREGWIGAAKTERVLRSLAPYVYAQRFVTGGRVGIVERDGANGASVLSRTNSVDASLGSPERNDWARQWFDLDAYRAVEKGATYDVSIAQGRDELAATTRIVLSDAMESERTIEVARPIPPSITVSFDPADAEIVQRFAVSSPSVPARSVSLTPMRIVGGSAGRIGIVVRDDFASNTDADSDAAFALAQRLEEQGFTPAVVGVGRAQASDFDLLHLIGLSGGPLLEGLSARARERGLPVVIAPYCDDPSSEAAWGSAGTALALRLGYDAATRDYYLAAIARRQFDAPNVPARGSGTLAQDPAVRAVVESVRSAVVCAHEEEERLRDGFCFRGEARAVAALLGDEPPRTDIGSLAGPNEFVLVHGPVEPRCNQLAIAQSATRLGYSLVLLGTVLDVEYYVQTMSVIGPRGIWLPENRIEPGELAALYGRARVFADASWSGRGLHRLARAGAYGCSLVAPSSGYARNAWPGFVQTVDPASPQSVYDGLEAAWRRAPELGPATAQRIAETCDPFAALVATLDAYKEAATPVKL